MKRRTSMRMSLESIHECISHLHSYKRMDAHCCNGTKIAAGGAFPGRSGPNKKCGEGTIKNRKAYNPSATRRNVHKVHILRRQGHAREHSNYPPSKKHSRPPSAISSPCP